MFCLRSLNLMCLTFGNGHLQTAHDWQNWLFPLLNNKLFHKIAMLHQRLYRHSARQLAQQTYSSRDLPTMPWNISTQAILT